MSKKFSDEEFKQFVVEQFGKLTADVTDVRSDVASARTEMTDLRADVASVRGEMQTGFRELRSEVVEISEILKPLAKAFDKDAETIIDHGRRIGRLEEHVGIPKHA
jgi:hypothetical protein